jgi:hypothetical protein
MSPFPAGIVQPRCRSRTPRGGCEKAWPISIAFGSRVFICDNTAFVAEQIVRRKHTKQAKRDLPSLVAHLLEPLTEQREAQARAFERFKATALTDQTADHAIMTMYREGVINVQRIADVEREWREPSFAYEQYVDRSAWQLFNAAAFALKDRVTDYDTPKLHRIIDGVCEAVH